MNTIEATVKINVPRESTWSDWSSVKITTEFETITVLNRILLQRGTFSENDSIALAKTVFRFETGWVRVDGGWAHWDRNEVRDQIRFAFLNEPKKGE
jgi:hypothetical protein